MKFKYTLPPIYQKLIPQNILDFDIQETKATCDRCLMSQTAYAKDQHLYRADLKCCTFQPFLPNFIIGALLKDETELSSRIKSVLHNKIQDPECSFPVGLVAPMPYQKKFNQKDARDFGQREDLLCAYYNRDQQNCGIWRYRGSVCTGFFCYSSYGENGQKFWSIASDYLAYIENTFMQEILVRLDFSPEQINELTKYIKLEKFEPMDSKLYKRLWNAYSDPFDFFKKCHDILEQMSEREINDAWAGHGLVIQKQLESAFHSL